MLVTVTNDFGTVLTAAATPDTNVPSLRTANLLSFAWHGHPVTVMHTFSSIPMVTSVLHAGDAFISLSGLEVEPKRDDILFALVLIPGLRVSPALNGGMSILLEDTVSKMCLADT